MQALLDRIYHPRTSDSSLAQLLDELNYSSEEVREIVPYLLDEIHFLQHELSCKAFKLVYDAHQYDKLRDLNYSSEEVREIVPYLLGEIHFLHLHCKTVKLSEEDEVEDSSDDDED